MPFKKGMIPINKGKKKPMWIRSKIYTLICPVCNTEIKTKRRDQKYCNIFCYAKSDKLREFALNSNMIKNNSIAKYHKGFKHSEETKTKIMNHLNRYSFPKGQKNPGVNKSPITILKIKEKRLHQKILKKDTKPEIIIQTLLRDLGIKFIKHKPITQIEHEYQCDIFIHPNFVIECDGDYYHNYPSGREIDRVRNRELQEKGFKILRFWEHQIHNNLDFCKNEILEALK
jgi:very-short-patch-repair endonuclease